MMTNGGCEYHETGYRKIARQGKNRSASNRHVLVPFGSGLQSAAAHIEQAKTCFGEVAIEAGNNRFLKIGQLVADQGDEWSFIGGWVYQVAPFRQQ